MATTWAPLRSRCWVTCPVPGPISRARVADLAHNDERVFHIPSRDSPVSQRGSQPDRVRKVVDLRLCAFGFRCRREARSKA